MAIAKIIDFYERGGLTKNDCAGMLLVQLTAENVDQVLAITPFSVLQEIRNLVADWQPGVKWWALHPDTRFPSDEQMRLAKKALERLRPIA